MFRRLFPNSFVSQMVVLVGALALLSLGLHLAVVTVLRDALVSEFAKTTGGRIQATKLLLETTPEAERNNVIAPLQLDRYKIIFLGDKEAKKTRKTVSFPEPFLKESRASLGQSIDLIIEEQTAFGSKVTLSYSFQVDGKNWQIDQQLDPPIMALIGTGFGWLLLLLGGVFASAIFVIQRVGRPIARVTKALSDGAQEPKEISLPRNASREVLTLTQSYNDWVQKLNSAEQLRRQLLAGVSHDMRTPLARARLRIETQVGEPTSTNTLNDLDQAEKILSQLLVYAQGDFKEGLGVADSVSAVVRQVCQMYRDKFALEATIEELEIERPDLAIQRIVSNLLDNAIAHGKPPFRLSLTKTPDANNTVLEVTDSGHGLSPDAWSEAIKPFVKLQNKPEALGHSGLGLAIVNQLATQIGAQLTAHQRPPGFIVRLVF